MSKQIVFGYISADRFLVTSGPLRLAVWWLGVDIARLSFSHDRVFNHQETGKEEEMRKQERKR